MSGLVGYDSSDEDDQDETQQVTAVKKKPAVVPDEPAPASSPVSGTKDSATEHDTNARQLPNAHNVEGPIAGPVAGPTAAFEVNTNEGSEEETHDSNRKMIMNLTLPPVPNFDIPGSPPGSPDPSVVDKLAQFAKLKKQGVHFNERLADSTAIKDPNLFSKLMESFGMTEEKQYATTLPTSIWDPTAFPDWAYKEELAKAQAEANQSRRRTGVQNAKLADNFVHASNTR